MQHRTTCVPAENLLAYVSPVSLKRSVRTTWPIPQRNLDRIEKVILLNFAAHQYVCCQIKT